LRGRRAARGKPPLSRVSIWKNEEKNRWLELLRGGFNGCDALYDSKQKLTGNHPCLIPKI
jgi:hypothetical protein